MLSDMERWLSSTHARGASVRIVTPKGAACCAGCGVKVVRS